MIVPLIPFESVTGAEAKLAPLTVGKGASAPAAPDVGLRLASKVAASNRTNIEFPPIRACKKANIGAWPAGVCSQGNNCITPHAQIFPARHHPRRTTPPNPPLTTPRHTPRDTTSCTRGRSHHTDTPTPPTHSGPPT